MNSQIIAFAIKSHADVNHLYDGNPYSVHLAMVAFYGQQFIDCIPEQAQQSVIDACWLHDVIEDCRLTYNDVRGVAGEEVANIVYALTNEKGKNRAERANESYYSLIRDTPFAAYVKICDRMANVKYSIDTESRMKYMYKKENDHFIKSLYGGNKMAMTEKFLISELHEMVNSI